MGNKNQVEFEISGHKVFKEVKAAVSDLVRKGQARRIILKDHTGEEVLTVPLIPKLELPDLKPHFAGLKAAVKKLGQCQLVVVKVKS